MVKVLVAWLVLAGLGLSIQAAGQPAGISVVEGMKPWDLKADILVLDVGSLGYQGNHPAFPPFTDPKECAQYCRNTVGCSGWTFCNRTAGCGSGCDQYAATNPELTADVNNPTNPSPSWFQLTAIKSFGPWGVTSGCMWDCSSGQCKQTGRWPHGMCSLKKVPDTAEPQFSSKDPARGWISGWIQLPKECAGMSARSCKRCSTSKSLQPCLACAKHPKLRTNLLASVRSGGIYTLSSADGCATCYNSTQPEKCTACLLEQKPCAACALQPDDGNSAKLDVLACIDCSSRYGKAYTGPCTTCASLAASPGAVNKCMGCLARASKVACNETTYPVTCYNPEWSGGVCAACAATAKDYEQCVDCVESKHYSESCYTCATFPEAAKQSKCYACVKAAPSPTTGCADCLSYLTDAKAVDQCHQCLTSSKTSAEARQWCFGCQNWCSSYNTRANCNQCLTTAQADYVTACACKD